jgi:hypothetical protein
MMSNTFKRLLLAACISATGVIGTVAWERLTAEKSGTGAVGEPIAQLMTVVRDVKRKPTQRLIWESISEGSQLFAGETIRTSSDSEARVEFLKSKTRIDLDPDSEIVIQEVDGKIELNFLKGNVFVASTGQPGAGGEGQVTLKAGDKNIALDGSELSLSQDANGNANVTVLKGDASLGSTSSQIKILSPQPNDSVYVSPKDKTPVAFAFAPIPDGYRVGLETGRRREDLKGIDVVEGGPGKIAAALKVGRIYWRLVAKSIEAGRPDLVSPVFRVNVLAKTPVVQLTPERDKVVALNELNGNGLPLAWSNPSHLDRLQVEVFRGRDFTKPLIAASVEEGSETFLAKLTEPGDYTWRVSGYIPGREEMVVGSIRAFRTIARKELTAPTLTSPRNDEMVPYALFSEKGLDLKWKSVEGATQYKLTVRNRKTDERLEHDAASPLFALRDLKPGDYEWSVRALNARGDESKISAVSVFSLLELAELRWADGKLDVDEKYFSPEPSIALAWEHGPTSAVKWRVRVISEREPASAEWRASDQLSLMTPALGDGAHTAEVEALDARGNVVARSSRRRVTLSALPLLDAPAFDSSLALELTASGAGSVRVAWNAVEGATEYIVSVDGKETRLATTETILKKLMPGKYNVTLRSIDSHGRRGPASEARSLFVPNKSDVKAPRLKKFNFD